MPERLMQRLANGGRTGVFIAALVLILFALLVPGWGGALLVTVIVAIMATISRRTWAVQPPRLRVMRMTILIGLLIIAYVKATHA
jgi:glucose-6-phosphate-specific signal transduction histidine kinase